jgi:tetratricopeptide (TPR) repeat protein
MRTTTLLLIPLLVLALAAPAFAQDDRARELFDNGALLYEEGDYENAVIAWKEAYDLSPKPLLLYNIANALERIGEWQEAHDYLNRYRAFAPAEERATLDRRMRAIERRIEQAPIPTNDLTTTSSKPAPAGPSPGPFILIGAGAGGLAVGGIFGGLAMGARNDAAALCTQNGDDVLCPDTARQALDDDQTYSLVADIGMVAGGVAAGAGVVLAIVDSVVGPKKASAVRIIPAAGNQGGSVTLIARF